jgi:hypothetical protein
VGPSALLRYESAYSDGRPRRRTKSLVISDTVPHALERPIWTPWLNSAVRSIRRPIRRVRARAANAPPCSRGSVRCTRCGYSTDSPGYRHHGRPTELYIYARPADPKTHGSAALRVPSRARRSRKLPPGDSDRTYCHAAEGVGARRLRRSSHRHVAVDWAG